MLYMILLCFTFYDIYHVILFLHHSQDWPDVLNLTANEHLIWKHPVSTGHKNGGILKVKNAYLHDSMTTQP